MEKKENSFKKQAFPKRQYSKKILKFSLLLFFALSTISLPIQKTPWYDIHFPFSYSIDPKIVLQELDAAENDWGFVRQSAEWARGNGLFIDGFISAVASNPWLNSPGTREFENVQLGTVSTRFKVRVEIQVDQVNIASGSYTEIRTFKNKLEIRRQIQNDLALQLFFDSTSEITDNGALMYYNLAKLNPDGKFFDNSESTIVETFLFKKPDGLRRQVYTWKNAPKTRTSITDSGRVVLDEVLNGKTLCFRTVAKVDRAVLQELAPSVATNSSILNACGNPTSGDFYYVLSYMQNFDFPFLTTAKYGWTGDSTRKEGFCAISNTNNNYGIFDDKGFVRDRVSATAVPAGYPSPNQGEMSVDSAFIATFTSATGLGYSAPGSDDTSKAFIDGVSTNVNINFK